jgi:hypothetical protein
VVGTSFATTLVDEALIGNRQLVTSVELLVVVVALLKLIVLLVEQLMSGYWFAGGPAVMRVQVLECF